MDIPWISITGVRTIEDIYIIDTKYEDFVPSICANR